MPLRVVMYETAPTKVVFPTPNPPATTIFAEVTVLLAIVGAESRVEPMPIPIAIAQAEPYAPIYAQLTAGPAFALAS